MRRFLMIATVVAAISSTSLVASGAATAKPNLADSAPADEYFGPLGMSPLSIRSTIGFLGRQYHWRTISDRDLLRKALLTEDALQKWRAKYPRDPWLAPTYFHLEQLYQAVQTTEARKHATKMLKATVFYFPDTKQGHLSRLRLAQGFPPLVPESPLRATPEPATSAPSAAPEGSATPIPEASGSPPPSGVPSAIPSPGPT